MSGRIGIEVTAGAIRGVVLSGWRDTVTQTFDVAFDPAQPTAAVQALRATVAAPDAISMAIGMPFLHVARVQLPPSDAGSREAMVQLEPQRFFTKNSAVRASLAPGSDVAFAVDSDWLTALEGAIASWGPVVRIEPAPVAFVAAVPADARGTFALSATDGEWAAVEVRDGVVASVRRGPVGTELPTRSVTDGRVPVTHLTALGTVLRDDAPLVGTLQTTVQRAAARRRTRQGVAAAVLAAVAGLAFLFVAADRSRERTLAALESRAARLTSEARPALDAQAHLASRRNEAIDVRAAQAGRADPLTALAALGRLLPRDVVILSARAKGNEWQIEGTARDAAALVPLLDADPRFDNVRSLAGTSRFRDGTTSRESFSIALHVNPAP